MSRPRMTPARKRLLAAAAEKGEVSVNDGHSSDAIQTLEQQGWISMIRGSWPHRWAITQAGRTAAIQVKHGLHRQRSFLIELEGSVFRFSRAAWERFLADGARDERSKGPTEYGATYVGIIDHHPLDWSREEYARELAELRGEPAPTESDEDGGS